MNTSNSAVKRKTTKSHRAVLRLMMCNSHPCSAVSIAEEFWKLSLAQNVCCRCLMEWVSMFEQLHASLTSPCTKPSIGCSGVMHWTPEWPITLLRLLVWSQVLGLVHARCYLPEFIVPYVKFGFGGGHKILWGCFSGPLLQVEGNVNASAYQDKQCYALFREQFRECPFLFQYDCATV